METQEKYETEVAPLGIVEITEANLALMKKQILEIPAMPENKEQYNASKEMHIQAKKVLPLIEQRRKEIKAPHLEKCREIDATAKTAKAMIEPIIEMAGDRRGAWEAEIAAQKEAERVAEQARLDGINAKIEELKLEIAGCVAYGVPAERIKIRLEYLEAFPVTDDIFQEHIETARTIRENGIVEAKKALENRLAFEDEQAKLEAEKKAQAEAQAKIDAANKAEADRLAKIAADQKAEIARVQAEQEKAQAKINEANAKVAAAQEVREKKIREAQEAEARKLAEEKAAFEAEKKAMAQAEAARVEAARIAERDRLWSEALPIHIWEYVYPVALEANKLVDEIKAQQMDAQAKRSMDIMRNRNAIDSMVRNVLDVVEMARQGIDMPELNSFVNDFERAVKNAEAKLNHSIATLLEVK